MPRITPQLRPARPAGRRGGAPRRPGRYCAAGRAFLLLCIAYTTGAAARDRDDYDRWALCPTGGYEPLRPRGDGEPHPAGTLQLAADAGRYVEGEGSTFLGTVELVRDGQAIRADRLTYDEAGNLVNFSGSAGFWVDNFYWEGDAGELALDRQFARFDAGRYRILGSRGTGRAETISADLERELTSLRGVDYTTCPGPDPAWRFEASSIELDHVEEWGTARNVRVKIHDIPVLYLPYLSFPLSDRRKTGFLPPTIGSTNDSGLEVTVPFYWNMAPARDMTIAPRVMADRGVMLTGEFRYMLAGGYGKMEGEFLPSDDEADGDNRTLFSLTHNQFFGAGRGTAYVNYNHVSDKEYFEDFGNSLAVASTRFLEQRADVRYWGDWWYAFARVQNYQSVDPSLAAEGIAGPYKRLPQFYALTRLPERNRRFNLRMEAESSYFDRDLGVTGGRLNLRPSVNFPMRSRGTELVPQVELRYAKYLLDGNPASTDSPSRAVPAASLDGRLFLERELSWRGIGMLQTLEPRMYYLYVPQVEQDDIPVFDAGLYAFSFAQIFRDDRFGGFDRDGDTHQVSVGVQSRILENERGFERLRAGIGQIYYIEDREVFLPGDDVDTSSASELVAEAVARLTYAWSLGGALQWDPDAEQTRKAALRLRYRPDQGPILNLDYRMRDEARTDIEQTDVSVRWPIGLAWNVVGRWNYSFADAKTLEVVGGVEYNTCCWGVRVAARRFLSTTTGEFDTGVFFNVELKGLAGIGRQATSLIRRSVPGYEPEF